MKINFTRLLILSVFIGISTVKTFAQYCTPTYTNLCSSGDFVNNFAFNTLTNLNTGCNGNANNYIYYSTTPTTSVQQGNTYAVAMQSGSAWPQGFGVWIDYNKDNDFADAGELIYTSPTADTALFSGNILIPLTASLGVTRLRVRCQWNTVVTAGDSSCSNYAYGETEDYNITITASAACTNPPTAGTALSTADTVCSGATFTLGLTGNSNGTGQTYQWQSSPNNSTWTNISGATGLTYVTSETASTYYRCMVTCGTSVPSASHFVAVNVPIGGNATSSVDSVCSGTAFTLSLQGNSNTSGQTYQWQSSPDNSVWTNITGATTLTYTTTETASTYYRCTVTCGTSVFSTSHFVTLTTGTQCYCVPPHPVCSATDNIDTFLIAGTTLNNAGTGCTNTNGNAYTIYPASGNTTATLQQGTAYTFSVTSTASSIISIWIDYNQDGTFASTEWTQVTTVSTANVASSVSITIPFSSLLGQTRLRVRSRAQGNPNGAVDACTTFGSGEAEDYTITISSGSACTNPPVAGTTVSSANPACAGVAFTLSLSGGTTGSGQTYQWQSSPNGTTFTNIGGDTSASATVTQSATTYYRCIVTCGTSSNSSVLQVTMNPFSQCYCDTLLHGVTCDTTDYINNVSILTTTLNNNNTGCTSGNGPKYTVYPASGNTTATLLQGTSYTFSVTSHTNSIISVWIDFNHNGMYEASEWTQVATSTTPDSAATASITIPPASLIGQTGMRVRSRASGAQNGATDACTEFFSGETEDYTITITASACTNPPTAGNAVTTDTVVCGIDTFTVSLTGNSTGGGQTYQWQFSPNNTTWNNISGATTASYTLTQTLANYYRCMVTCGTSVPSASVFVNIKSCYCDSLLHGTACSPTDNINDFSITATTLNNSNTGCTSGNGQAYTVYPPSGNTTANLQQGLTYAFNVTSTTSSIISIWIDYNKNSVYEASEWTQVTTASTANVASSINITIPVTSGIGKTGLRVRSRVSGAQNGATDACTEFFSGETEDYTVTLLAQPPCTNPPIAGTTVATPNAVCPGGAFVLSLSGNSNGTGQTYQWQSSPNNTTWTNISGAINFTDSTSQTAATFYRCMVTCSTSAASASVLVNILSLSAGTASGPSSAIGNQEETFNLSGSNGTSFQWQSSTDNVNFTDITGATTNPQVLVMPGTAVNDTIYTRVKVSGGGCADVFTNSVMTIINCATPYNNPSSTNDFVNHVIFNTINTTTTIDSMGGNVQDFKGTPGGTTNVCKGMSYTLTVSTDSAWTEGKAAWIDYNNNGSFSDAGELVFLSPTTVGAVTDTVTIPNSAASATVRMRVLCVYAATPDSNACYAGPYAYGELEEYSIIINPTPDATITASGPLTFCSGSNVTLTTGLANSYNWSNGATTQSITVNSSGTYIVTGTDNGVCSSSDTAVVTVNASPSAVATATNAACGSSNGSASVTASGGTTPNSYLWSNSMTTSSITNLTAGTYFVTVTDTQGCTATASASVNNTGGPSVAVSTTNVSCNGGNNGVANAVASAGTTPYTYLWSNGATSASLSGLGAGTYTITVTDNTNCKASSAVIITQPSALSLASSMTNVSCNGGNNGSASLTVNGGTSPYTYNWSNGATSASLSGISAGTYSVTVKDVNQCGANATIIITQPSAISAVASSTNVSCNGGNNGSAAVNVSGGNSPYSYLWSNGSTTLTASGLVSGTYTVTVTDANGCTANKSVTITQPNAMALSTASTNAACGSNNGSATVTASGGATPFSYQWSNGQTTATAAGLTAGNYSVTVTDANGCSANTSVAVSNNGGPTVTATANSVSCNGSNNGSVMATATGGATPYTYLWSTGQNTQTISNLSAGTYSVTVNDGAGCSTTATTTVNSPATLVSTATSTNSQCNSGSTGTATVTTSGGTSPYSYSWSNGATSATLTGLGVGTYTVTITDANFCSTSAFTTVSGPPAITVTTTATNANCGSSNGTATASASGGVGSFTYLWSNGQASATATSLAAATYTVTATDSTGCTSSASASVSNTGAPLVTVSVNNVFCNGGNNGSAVANATGGASPYTFNWSNGQTTASANGLSAGTYTVTVTDANNCITIKTANITQPPALVLTTSSNGAACGSSNGNATASVSGGVSPYQYSWSGGQTTPAITNLSAGTYNVTVADANGCLQSGSANVSNIGAPTINVSHVDVNCPGDATGTVSVAASGGASPYSYIWSNGVLAGATITGLAAGTYSVTVTDNAGCKSVGSATVSATNSAPTVNLGTDTTSCGSVMLNAGSGFSSYLWSTAQTTQTISAVTTGTFSVTVTDANGCKNSDAVNVTVSAATPVNLGADTSVCDSISAMVLNAGNGYTSYLWSNNSTAQTLTITATGTYSVTVTDANGCTDADSITVSFDPCGGINEISGGISVSIFPNPNKGRFILSIQSEKLKEQKMNLVIYNVLGEEIYKSQITAYKSELDLKNYGTGVYYLKIITTTGIVNKRIIVE